MQIRSPLPPNLAKGLLSLVMGGMVTAYMVDATPTHMSLFQRRYAVPQLQEAFEKITGALTLLVPVLLGARLDREAARRRVDTSPATAADLAGAMVDKAHISWRTAHQICGILFRLCEEEGFNSSRIDSALVDRAAVEYFDRPLGLDQAWIDDALDPNRYVHRRTSPGGSAPEEVRRQLSNQQKRLDEWHQWLRSARAQTTESTARLESAIDEILSA
jgi:argininosuccinate lyase